MGFWLLLKSDYLGRCESIEASLPPPRPSIHGKERLLLAHERSGAFQIEPLDDRDMLGERH